MTKQAILTIDFQFDLYKNKFGLTFTLPLKRTLNLSKDNLLKYKAILLFELKLKNTYKVRLPWPHM